MAELHPDRVRAISNELHPLVNLAIVAFVLMVVAAVWTFFAGDAYAAWLDVVITGLFVIAMSIPALLWATWLRNTNHATGNHRPGFRQWASGEFETWTGSVKATSATVEILLPIAALAIGMAGFGLIFHLVAASAA